MPGQTNECALESYIEEILLASCAWKVGGNEEWDKERALFWQSIPVGEQSSDVG